MECKLAATPFQQLPKPICPQSPSSSRALASTMSSKRRSYNAGRIIYRCRSSDSSMFGAQSTKILRSRHCELPKSRPPQAMNPAFSARFRSFTNDEFSNLFQELSGRQTTNIVNVLPDYESDSRECFGLNSAETELHLWEEDGIFAGSIERKANCVGLPLSVRMIKRKLRWQERVYGEPEVSEDSSIKSAFSSMVLIIRELQSYSLQMREFSSCEDLEGMLIHVRQETHASFIWLFERVFSRTPTLMVYLMVLVANFSAQSIGINAAMAASASVIESDVIVGEDRFIGLTREAGTTQWESSGEEASSMQESIRNEVLSRESVEELVTPGAKIKSDDYAEYLKTEALYQIGLSQEPNNQLLLANFAQFLYLIAHDFDRAEEHFKRAVVVEPADAEALSKYAKFLWEVRNDLWAAEETFLEAISAEPTNSFYHADYAHFLFSTGAEDTCFPLPSSSLDQAEINTQEQQQ